MKAKQFAIYNYETGEIRCRISVGIDGLLINLREGESGLPTEGDRSVTESTHYVNNGKITPRPLMDISVSATNLNPGETLKISNIPPGTELEVLGQIVVIDDGDAEWSTEIEGQYVFTLKNFPYQEEVINVQVAET